jgi:hypothetical protein
VQGWVLQRGIWKLLNSLGKNELGKSVAAAQLLDFLLCGLTWDEFNLNNCVLQFLEWS